MIFTIIGVFDSDDAAQFASDRLTRDIGGIQISGISTKSRSDKSDEDSYFVMVNSNAAASNFLSSDFIPNISGLPSPSAVGSIYHNGRQEGVCLFVETDDKNKTASIASIMKEFGGRDIQIRQR